MQVVAAAVHDPGVDGREIESGILVDRQAVDVGAQCDRRAGVLAGDLRHDAGLHRIREHIHPVPAQDALQIGARLDFVERAFRVCVQVAADGDELIGERDVRGDGFHHGVLSASG